MKKGKSNLATLKGKRNLPSKFQCSCHRPLAAMRRNIKMMQILIVNTVTIKHQNNTKHWPRCNRMTHQHFAYKYCPKTDQSWCEHEDVKKASDQFKIFLQETSFLTVSESALDFHHIHSKKWSEM